MLEDGLEDVENMYTTQLNDYFYSPRKKMYTQSYTHNVNYTTSNSTKGNGTQEDTPNNTE